MRLLSSVRPSVTIRYRVQIGWNTSKIISPPNSDKMVMWRFLRNRRLILRLHYFLGTHILGASRGGPCDSVASCYCCHNFVCSRPTFTVFGALVSLQQDDLSLAHLTRFV